MKIAIKDNIVAEVEKGTTIGNVARSISPTLAKNIICGKINGALVDLDNEIGKNCKLEFITTKDNEASVILNETASHILAQAVKSVYPSVKLAFGGEDEKGFYYDFEFKTAIKEGDLPTLEEEIRQIVNAGFKITNTIMSKEDALASMTNSEEPYKIEMLEGRNEDELSVYAQGNFIDFCDKPHIKSTAMLKCFKLVSIEPVYYKTNVETIKLTRIRGVAAFKTSELESKIKYLNKLRKRDHLRLGKDMELFLLNDNNRGCPYWLPNGWSLYNAILDYSREINNQYGYMEINSPILSDNQLSIDSGHYSYCTNDFFEVNKNKFEEDYILKTANCPSSIFVYKCKERSFKEFPLRLVEFGLLHRKLEESNLNGLFNARSFRQDAAHIFLSPKQIEEEFEYLFEACEKFYKTFGMKYSLELSTRPLNFVGDSAVWERAENILSSILDNRYGEGNYKVNEGGGSFFGPRIDIVVKDSVNRKWRMGSFQLDMQLPERFELNYTDEKNNQKVPILIHRTILGSIERFMAVLIENFEGKFPFWLAPVQTIIVTELDENNSSIIKKLKTALQSMGIRCKIVNGKFGEVLNRELFKIEKVPYILSVDKGFAKKHNVLVEVRGEKQIIIEADIKDFLEKINRLNKSRGLNLIKDFQ